MIDYRTNTKYTAQKVQDKASRGAFFYTQFTVKLRESDNGFEQRIEDKIKKLDEIFHLELTSTQRNYRLKMGKPIADLIVQQDVFDTDVWYFILMVTTPKTRHFAKVTGLKDGVEEENKNEPFKWNKDSKNAELKLIVDYFKDSQPFHFLLDHQKLTLKFSKYSAELVRMSHKSYKGSKNSKYKQPAKNYSWTWRFSDDAQDKLKMELKKILNNYISQKIKDKALIDLSNWQKKIKRWSVFKGTRSQAGSLQSFGKNFLYLKGRKRWDAEKLPLLELTILPRLTTYADSFSEYVHRRQLYILNSVEVPRDIAKLPHDEILDWIEDYEKRYSDSADGLMQEATELTESND